MGSSESTSERQLQSYLPSRKCGLPTPQSSIRLLSLHREILPVSHGVAVAQLRPLLRLNYRSNLRLCERTRKRNSKQKHRAQQRVDQAKATTESSPWQFRPKLSLPQQHHTSDQPVSMYPVLAWTLPDEVEAALRAPNGPHISRLRQYSRRRDMTHRRETFHRPSLP
jgi:hypothetical protein